MASNNALTKNGMMQEQQDQRSQQFNPFDPYRPTARTTPLRSNNCALLDEAEEPPHTFHVLEMEEDSISLPEISNNSESCQHSYPIATNSEFLLTHRRTTPVQSTSVPVSPLAVNSDSRHRETVWNGAPIQSPEMHSPPLQRTHLFKERFEVENPWSARKNPDSVLWQIKKLFSYARVWVFLSSLVLILGTAILLHHVNKPQENQSADLNLDLSAKTGSVQQSQRNSVRVIQLEDSYPSNQHPGENFEEAPDQIVLLPLDPSRFHPGSPTNPASFNSRFNKETQFHRRLHQGWQRKLQALRIDFQSWIVKHKKQYQSNAEMEYRFRVWAENHHLIVEKNERHGPCKMTNERVFGSNHFQDITNEEFENQYLNAKHVPLSRKIKERKLSSGTMGPHIAPIRHPEVHQRYLQMTGQRVPQPKKQKATYNCDWYDISCMVRWIVKKYFYGFYGIGMTMEPAYDSDTYPKAVDWRDVGAVTSVRSQDNCGACWAITAVECVESSNFISFGTLYDLAEYEIILCVDNSEMCYGGWPEDAFDYIMEHGGIPLEEDLPYDGDFLLALTQAKSGESSEMTEDDLDGYKVSTCPAGGGSQDSKDDNNNNGGSGFSRYGSIDGYGYATDRCVCYSDGSGCDCDSQDEGLAVANVATYGPAVVCVDASKWKDYTGGILTAEIGCSSAFLDVNHCIQAVGYAFYTEGGGSEGENSQSGSGDNSGSGSEDGSNRVGYWIVRNQWSEYWGMSGYAYVAMGDNTCGILNDMMQVYSRD